MRVIAEFRDAHPPLLGFYIFGAPHRRAHIAVLQEYRAHLVAACRKIGLRLPIAHPIDMTATFIDPTSPDLDNLLTGLYRALDGKTLGISPSVLVDDGLIQHVKMGKLFINARKRAEQPRNLPSFAPNEQTVAA